MQRTIVDFVRYLVPQQWQQAVGQCNDAAPYMRTVRLVSEDLCCSTLQRDGRPRSVPVGVRSMDADDCSHGQVFFRSVRDLALYTGKVCQLTIDLPACSCLKQCL